MARIAYVINSVEGGGAALPVPAVARVLQANGAEVRVFALTRRDGRALPSMTTAGLDPLVRDGSEDDHWAALRWLARETRAWGATHLWTSLSRATILGLLAGPWLGLPVVAWQHNAFLKPGNRRLMRLLQRRAHLWVADSGSVALLTRDRLRVPEARLRTWSIFAADPYRPQACGWQAGMPLRIGSLGRLHSAKGYDVLLDALAHLRCEGFVPPIAMTLAIGGSGAEHDRLRALIKAHDLPVDLAGYETDPGTFLASKHLYLQPSRAEGFCIAVHEALTAGLPVIASRVGQPALTIREGETGWLATPGDARSLARCLRDALGTPASLAAMGQAARADMLDRYSQGRFEETGGAIWRQVARSPAPAQF